MERRKMAMQIWRCLYPVGIHTIVGEMVVIMGLLLFGEQVPLYLYTVAAAVPCIFIFGWLTRQDREMGESAAFGSSLPPAVWLAVVVLGVAAGNGIDRILMLTNLDQLFKGYDEVADILFGNAVWMELIGIGLLVPAAEELLFRGLVYQRMKGAVGTMQAAVLSSILFGVWHGNLLQGIYAGLISFVCIYGLEATQSLLAPMLIHAAANICSILITETSYFDFLYRSNFQVAIIACVEIAVGFGMMNCMRKRRKKK